MAESISRGSRVTFCDMPVTDIELLARYCLEQGLSNVDGVIDYTLMLCNRLKRGQELNEEEQKSLIHNYSELESVAHPVNARTLQATQPLAFGDYFSSSTGRYLLTLWFLALMISPIIFLLQPDIIENFATVAEIPAGDTWLWVTYWKLSEYVLPFAYGTLGTCVYLLRKTESLLHSRHFDPSRLPEHWNRLVLGTLSGGVASMFIQDGDMGLAQGAIGFLAGYSVNLLFAAIDRTLAAILPKIKEGGLPEKEIAKLENKYKKLCHQAKSKEAREIVEKVLKDIKRD